MEKLIIEGPSKLKGTVEISGSKNSSLPILAATALFGEEYTIKNVPRISDVHTMLLLLETLGAEFSFYSNDVHIDTRKISKWEAPYDLVKTMRASVVIWGALLGRFGKAKISLPGGCAIGDRPVDQHLKGFRALGHDTEIVSGYLESFTSIIPVVHIVLKSKQSRVQKILFLHPFSLNLKPFFTIVQASQRFWT